MNKILRVTLLILFMVIVVQNEAFAIEDAGPAYLFSFFLGFGTGHFYLGDDMANSFLIAELIGSGALIAGYLSIYIVSGILFSDPNPGYVPFYAEFQTVMNYLMLTGVVFFVIARIWEIVDVFDAVERGKKAGTVAIVPRIEPGRNGILFGVSVLY